MGTPIDRGTANERHALPPRCAEIQDPEGTIYEPKSFLGVAICKRRLAALIAPVNCGLRSTRASSIPGSYTLIFRQILRAPIYRRRPRVHVPRPSNTLTLTFLGEIRRHRSSPRQAHLTASLPTSPHGGDFVLCGTRDLFASYHHLCLHRSWPRIPSALVARDRPRDLNRHCTRRDSRRVTPSAAAPETRPPVDNLSICLYWHPRAIFGTLTAAKVCVACVLSGEGCPPLLSPIRVTSRWVRSRRPCPLIAACEGSCIVLQEPVYPSSALLSSPPETSPWPNLVQPQIHRFMLPLLHVPVCRDRFRVPASPYNVLLRGLGNLFYRPELRFACTVQAGTPRSALVCGLWTMHADSFISGSSFLHEAWSGSGRQGSVLQLVKRPSRRRDLLTVSNAGEECYNVEDLARCGDPPGRNEHRRIHLPSSLDLLVFPSSSAAALPHCLEPPSLASPDSPSEVLPRLLFIRTVFQVDPDLAL
ncbi:hypothetical protein DFH08DRAFT_990403 [Mycena albidolilacea]|uniref:Uncharacterized protein n=1 Tax=Mycena albidolilacea TaxID=1033008 RepID=A0AAD7A9M1_9AGAR|nr:hypothetical protein DFH08DRAFT_990403 [Mycena albidolilacea]